MRDSTGLIIIFIICPIFIGSIVCFGVYGTFYADVTCINVEDDNGDDCTYNWQDTQCNLTTVTEFPEGYYYKHSDCTDIGTCAVQKCNELNTTTATFCCDGKELCSAEFLGSYKTTYWLSCDYDRHISGSFIEKYSMDKIPEISSYFKAWFNTKYRGEYLQHLRYDDPLSSRIETYNKLLLAGYILLGIGVFFSILLAIYVKKYPDLGSDFSRYLAERRKLWAKESECNEYKNKCSRLENDKKHLEAKCSRLENDKKRLETNDSVPISLYNHVGDYERKEIEIDLEPI